MALEVLRNTVQWPRSRTGNNQQRNNGPQYPIQNNKDDCDFKTGGPRPGREDPENLEAAKGCQGERDIEAGGLGLAEKPRVPRLEDHVSVDDIL